MTSTQGDIDHDMNAIETQTEQLFNIDSLERNGTKSTRIVEVIDEQYK